MSSVRRPHGRLLQIRGPAAPKLLSPKTDIESEICKAVVKMLKMFYFTPNHAPSSTFHINSTKHSIITQAASQWVLCFSGSRPIALIYLRLIIFFVLFSENKYDDDGDVRDSAEIFCKICVAF